MIRILNIEPEGYCDEARDILKQLGSLREAALSREELLEQLPEYEVLIVRLANQIDQEVLDAGCHLKAIVTATTGQDHIDVEYARKQGITVLSLRGETEFLRTIVATAEHTWALLLTLLRRIPAALESVRTGEWDRDRFRGQELGGKRLGIVGYGRLGEKVARYGVAFDMVVSAYDPYLSSWPDHVGPVTSLEELFSESDVVSLHLPLNDETTGMIGEKVLSCLPEGAILVNTSRGELIDEKALIQALEHGRLAGAALDVIVGERDEKRLQSPLLDYARHHQNLLITPHIAGATHESMAKTEIFMAHKLATYLEVA